MSLFIRHDINLRLGYLTI